MRGEAVTAGGGVCVRTQTSGRLQGAWELPQRLVTHVAITAREADRSPARRVSTAEQGTTLPPFRGAFHTRRKRSHGQTATERRGDREPPEGRLCVRTPQAGP